MHKASVFNFFFLPPRNLKYMFVLPGQRDDHWCLAAILKITVRESPSQGAVWLAVGRPFTYCATFVTGIWVMIFFLVLVWNFMCDHWFVLFWNTNPIIIWGLLRHLYVFLIDLMRNLKLPAYISVIRKASSFESIKSSITDSYFHPSSICCGNFFIL